MTLSGLRKSLRIRLLAGTLFWIAASGFALLAMKGVQAKLH